jgi:hypothetical protein
VKYAANFATPDVTQFKNVSTQHPHALPHEQPRRTGRARAQPIITLAD